MNISLALGGGGARGIAHIGVLARLEQHGFRIRAISGTSAGGIIAAIYAAGFSPAEILERFSQLDQSSLFGREPEDWPAMLGVAGLNRVLHEMLADCTFAELKIPCALTAVDLDTEEEVVLSEGRVVDAILATIALPGVFPPKQWEGRHLVDGGILDPVPVLPARGLAKNLPVVAVVLSSMEVQGPNYLGPPAFLAASPLLRRFSRLRLAQAFNIFIHSINISSRYMTMMRLEADRPEVIIHPEVADVGLLDRVDVVEIARRGELAVEAVLPALRRAAGWASRFRRRFSSPPL